VISKGFIGLPTVRKADRAEEILSHGALKVMLNVLGRRRPLRRIVKLVVLALFRDGRELAPSGLRRVRAHVAR